MRAVADKMKRTVDTIQRRDALRKRSGASAAQVAADQLRARVARNLASQLRHNNFAGIGGDWGSVSLSSTTMALSRIKSFGSFGPEVLLLCLHKVVTQWVEP